MGRMQKIFRRDRRKILGFGIAGHAMIFFAAAQLNEGDGVEVCRDTRWFFIAAAMGDEGLGKREKE